MRSSSVAAPSLRRMLLGDQGNTVVALFVPRAHDAQCSAFPTPWPFTVPSVSYDVAIAYCSGSRWASRTLPRPSE